jgi:hypothetical protein
VISESDEDDSGLGEELQRWIELARSLKDVEECAAEFVLTVRAVDKLVTLCMKADEQGQQLGRVSAIRTTTILRVLTAELTGREVTVEMPGVVRFRPEEVELR